MGEQEAMTAATQSTRPGSRSRGSKLGASELRGGFTLIEVMVALAVMAIAVMSLMGLRSESIMTATEARNLRVASSLAQEKLSEIRAGLHNAYDIRSQRSQFEDYDEDVFTYEILIGEADIEEELSREAEAAADNSGGESDQRQLDRLNWLHDRSASRRARAAGGSRAEYRDAGELDVDDSPDEESFEDVAVFVYYFAPRSPDFRGVYMLRSQASTLALSGLTPEQAQERNSGRNREPGR